jgi:hypothetical protein
MQPPASLSRLLPLGHHTSLQIRARAHKLQLLTTWVHIEQIQQCTPLPRALMAWRHIDQTHRSGDSVTAAPSQHIFLSFTAADACQQHHPPCVLATCMPHITSSWYQSHVYTDQVQQHYALLQLQLPQRTAISSIPVQRSCSQSTILNKHMLHAYSVLWTTTLACVQWNYMLLHLPAHRQTPVAMPISTTVPPSP